MKLWLDSEGTWTAHSVVGATVFEVPWEKRETLAAWLTEIGAGKAEALEPREPREPEPWEAKRIERTIETEKALGIEHEIQNCDLPRLAVLASNVAWRFQELAKKGGAS